MNSNDAWSLTGRRIAITGAGSGLGRAMADAFAEAGARVLGMDMSAHAPTDIDGRWRLLPGDITSEDDVDAFFAEAQKEFGGLDCVIGNAGVRGKVGPIDEWSVDDWHAVVEPNITGQFLVSRGAVKLLKETNKGRLVLLSSAAGRLAYPQRCGYSASKWAVVGLTKTLARELGPFGIRVNAVLPGLVRSPGAMDMVSKRAAAEDTSETLVEQRFLSGSALGEWVEVDDIVNAVRYLCTDAGAHVSGHTLNVDSFAERL